MKEIVNKGYETLYHTWKKPSFTKPSPIVIFILGFKLTLNI